MLQDCGGIENGVITPTDMLSFARQVAMAMVRRKILVFFELRDEVKAAPKRHFGSFCFFFFFFFSSLLNLRNEKSL